MTDKILKIVGKIHLHTYLIKRTMISNAMFSRSLITSLRSMIILSNFASKHKSLNLSDPEFAEICTLKYFHRLQKLQLLRFKLSPEPMD